MSCPNKSLPIFQELADEYGHDNAVLLYHMNSQEIPTLERARELMPKPVDLPKGGKYSDIKLQEPKFEDFSHIQDFVERYAAISKRKNELQAQGAQISGLTDTGFRWIPGEQENIYYQKLPINEAKTIKHGLQDIIQGKGQGREDTNIQTAADFYRPIQKTGQGAETRGQNGQGHFSTYIDTQGLRYHGQLPEREPDLIGSENKVWINPDGKTITKLHYDNGIHHNSEKNFLDSLLIHNYLFPDTAYKLLGYVDKPDSYGMEVWAVLEQPFVEKTGETRIDDIYKWLTNKGFQVEWGATNYYNPEIGIHIHDLHAENVINSHGTLMFIDTDCTYDHNLFKSDEDTFQQKTTSGVKPDTQLDNRLKKGFLKQLGVEVQHEVNEGQSYAAMVDTAKGILRVVDGKAGLETLGHESTHMFLDLLPEGSQLLHDIITDVKKRDEYEQVHEQYKGDPEYLNADGSINEDKMAKEVSAHIIDDIIADRFKNKKAMKWWQRLWNWIKELFTGKDLDSFHQVAEDILDANTSKLSKEKIAKIKEAAGKGEIYYQKSPEIEKRAEEVKKGANEVQKAMIDCFVLDPTEASDESKKTVADLGLKPVPVVVLEPESHIYSNPKTAKEYKSTTGQISGKFPEEKQKLYEHNKNAGNAFDKLLEHVINGKPVDEIMKSKLDMDFGSQDRMRDFITDAGNIVRDEQDDGSVVFAQVITSDPISGVAGSKDLCSFQPEGTERIIDLKTSIRRVFDKNGKEDKELSKTYTSKWVQNPGSVFNDLTEKKDDKGIITIVPRKDGEKPVTLSKNQQHGIQVGTYGKMDELQGVPVANTKTWHVQVDLQQREDGSFFIKDYKNEGLLDHPVVRNQEYIDQVIPTPLGEMSELQKEWLGVKKAEDPDTDKPTPEEAKATIESLNTSLDKIKEEFRRRTASALDTTGETSINELKNTANEIEGLQNQGEMQQAMAKAMNYIGDITRESLKFLSRDENYKHKQYFKFLTEALLISSSNDQLLPPRIRKHLTEGQQKTFDSIKANISELQEMSSIHAKEYILRNVSMQADPERPIDMSVLEDEWFPKQGIKDISQTGSWATNFDALRNKIIREAVNMVQVADKTRDVQNAEMVEQLAEKGNSYKLIHEEVKKNKEFWHFMYELEPIKNDNGEVLKDKSGNTRYKPTTYIKLIGDKYNNLADVHKSALLDDQGNYKKYIPLRVAADATQKDLDYNIELYHAKEANRKFNSPEQINKDGKIEDGDYHHMSDEYKAAEDNIFKVVLHTNFDDEVVGFERVLKEGLTEDSREVKQFRNRYQIRDKYESMTKGPDKKPTGVVVEKEGWFPNRKHVEVNEFARKTNIDGSVDRVDMRNPRYVDLMKDQSPLGREKWDAYKYFIGEYIKGATQAQGEVERFVRTMGIIALQSKFFQTAAKTGTMNNLKYQGAEFFTAVHKSNIEKTGADGITRMQLHIPYIGSLRSQERINDLQKKILELSAKKASMGKNEYRDKLRELNAQVEAESHKITGEDIELDPFKQLMAYRTGINSYVGRKDIEGQLQALDWALKEQKFVKTTGRGIAKTDSAGNSVYKADGDINAQRAMTQLIKNFYGISIEDTQMGVLIKRFQNLTTFGVMGLNILNGLNNTFLYQLNLAHQAIAGKFGMTAKNWAKAEKELQTKYIPGLVQKQFDKALKYGEKRPHSEAEAFIRKYQIKVDQRKQEGASGVLSKFYVFEGIAIDMAQIALAITGGYSYTIKNHDTGDIVPVYGEGGAHTYDPNTGDYTLNKGFRHEDVIEQIVRIGDVQTATQGNFQQITQPAMRQTILGRVGTQFKQFFATSWNNRFSQHYEHKTLGEQEGTWRSVVSLVEILKEYDGKWQEAFNPKSEFWKETPDYIKQNLMFDALDMVKLMVLFAIGALLKSFADDVSDSDPNQKRWMNFLAYTASRLRFEQQMFNPVFGWVQMGEFVQNPVAMSTTIRTFAEAMYLSAEFPFQTDDERYYHNGVFKGTSKAGHQIERVLPIARMHSRWIGLSQSQEAEGTVLGYNK